MVHVYPSALWALGIKGRYVDMFNQKLFDAEITRLRELFPECHIEAFTPCEYRIADKSIQDDDAAKIADYLYTNKDTMHMWQLLYKAIEYARNMRSLHQ
jgi:hypothetical protein